MTQEQILNKAIIKAKMGGFSARWRHDHIPMIIFRHDFAKALWGEDRYEKRLKKVVYSQGHMDSWGDGWLPHWKKSYKYMAKYKIHGWQYHLQQIVLEEDPIKYLEKFL